MDCSAFIAAKDGNVDFLKNVVNRKDILSKKTIQERNLLHIAAIFKQKEFARKIIESQPSLLSQADSKGDTPLHAASKAGCSGMVELFISSSKTLRHDIESHGGEGTKDLLRMVNQESDTALHVAVGNGHLDVVKLLVKADAELLNMHNNADESPLYLAVERCSFDIASYILDVSPLCSHRGTNGMTALHAAIIRTYQGRDFGITSPALSFKGFQNILLAYFTGNMFRIRGNGSEDRDHVPELSLERGRRLLYNWFFGLKDYIRRSVSDQVDVVEILLEKNKDMVKEADIFKWTPLHCAAHLGHLKATRKLLECDSSVACLLDKENASALHVAAKNGHINVMKEIIKSSPCTYNLIDSKGWTILHVAAVCGKARVVSFILKDSSFESLINETDNEGNTSLHLAAIYGNYNVVWILASDDRVDKKATNRNHLKAIDIVQSNIEVGEFIKFWTMKKLTNAGGRESLKRSINNRETTTYRKTNYSEGLLQGPTTEAEIRDDKQRPSLDESGGVVDRNKEVEKRQAMGSKYLKELSNTHLLVATVIATLSFAAGFSLPGGYNDDDPNKGKAALSRNAAFRVFVIADGIAFYCSTAAVLHHFFASLEHNYHLLLRFIRSSTRFTYIAILGMVVAFTSGTYAVMPDSSGFSTAAVVIGCVFLAFYAFGAL